MTDPVERRDLVERLTKIADASLRADGTDIPLGTELRAAAAEITRLRSLLTPGEGAETTAEERAAWADKWADDAGRCARDLVRSEARVNATTAEFGHLLHVIVRLSLHANEATARAERLAGALRMLQRQALQSPDLRSTEWGQEALEAARAALLTEPEAKGGDPDPGPTTTGKTDAQEALRLAALDAVVCVHECPRCGYSEPIKDWDISRHVLAAARAAGITTTEKTDD